MNDEYIDLEEMVNGSLTEDENEINESLGLYEDWLDDGENTEVV